MKNQWRIILGFFLVLIIVLFALLNNSQVNVNLLVATIKAPLILIILGSAIIGIAIAFLTTTAAFWSQKKEIKRLEKELNDCEEDTTQKITEKTESVSRNYENKLSELRASYEAQLVDKNRQIDQLLSNERLNRQASPDQMDYFD